MIDKIKIGYREYDVIYDEGLDTPNENDDTFYGMIDYTEEKIKLNPKYKDKKYHQLETFIHEVLHGIFKAYGYEQYRTDENLVNNTLSYIKSGNGIDSVDEIVKTESVKQKLVYATVTYTNKSDEEINHVLYIGTLLLMDHEDGAYQIYDPTEQSGDDYDRVIWDGVARTAEMTYNSISEDYGNGGNYISSLKPGESIQVNMAWIVNENDLNNMYLNLNGDGAAYEFSDSMLKTGLVDIYQ